MLKPFIKRTVSVVLKFLGIAVSLHPEKKYKAFFVFVFVSCFFGGFSRSMNLPLN